MFCVDDGVMDDPGVLVGQVRKRRSAAEKRLIVEQALQPGASVARVARVISVFWFGPASEVNFGPPGSS